MTEPSVAAVILAAGHGTRMKSERPKVLHEIGGRPMLGHVLGSVRALGAESATVVIGEHARAAGDYALAERPDVKIAVQDPPQGTGDAVKVALPALGEGAGAVLVLYADTPLVRPETMRALADQVLADHAAVAVLGFRPEDPGAYGRLKLSETGALEAIVEAKDAAPDELKIALCNSGVMAIEAGFLHEAIHRIDNNNAKGEYYLTDLVAIARADGRACAMIEAAPEEVLGVNDRTELASAERVFQERKRREAMLSGVTLIDPETVHFSTDTEIGADSLVHPHVFFGPGTRIGRRVEIKSFSHIEGAHIAEGAKIGPFARLRPKARIGANAKIGNFVEIKSADVKDGAKISHLSYIGDALVGAGANIGAGTITCNYDGYGKHVTTIGEGAFIGSNSALVAPVAIGDGAYVGSGSVITKDVEPGDLAVARGRQAAIKGWAERFRSAHQKKDQNHE